MVWITPADVTAVYASDDPTTAFVDHVQALAEIEIGTIASPTTKLKAVMVEIVHRMWAAINDDPNVTQEQLGSWSSSRRSGLSLTNAEKRLLRKAVGRTGLYVQGTTREDQLETAGPTTGDDWLEGAL
jgi:hypothetical protein